MIPFFTRRLSYFNSITHQSCNNAEDNSSTFLNCEKYLKHILNYVHTIKFQLAKTNKKNKHTNKQKQNKTNILTMEMYCSNQVLCTCLHFLLCVEIVKLLLYLFYTVNILQHVQQKLTKQVRHL